MTDQTPPTRALPPWWAVLLVALAIAAVAFSIGRFSAFTPGTTTPGTNSPEAGFARDMQVHHTQAIEMSMTIYRITEDDDVRMLSHDIATSQAGQRGEFYDWLVQWGLPQRGDDLMGWMASASTGHDHDVADGAPLTEQELMEQMGMATPEELAELDSSAAQEADCLYLELMIRHHEGAIPMADALVELGQDVRAVQVAQGISQAQAAEIDLMRSLRDKLSCSA